MGLDVSSFGNAFAWNTSNVLSTRPAAALGATITPGNNVKGSYTQVLTGANVARDVFRLAVNINSNAVSAAGRNALIDIAVDPAGGSSYSVLINNLMGSCAAPYTIGQGGIWYVFPIWIKAGSSVAARAQVNNATVGTMRIICSVFGSPRDRRSVRVGTKVQTLGADTATSAGVAVTSGTTAEGAWTSLGTLTSDAWWWQVGMGVNDTTMTALSYHADLGVGDATNKNVVIENMNVTTTAAEQMNYGPIVLDGQKLTPSGTNVYGRLQCSGTADSALSMVAYAVGG